MRFSYLLALVLVIALGTLNWYQRTNYICPIPVEYRLGAIDASFDITPDEARTAVDTAVALWEDATGYDLFVYDDEAALTVSFVFDERQARADAQELDEAALDEAAIKNEALRETVAELQTTYEEMQGSFQTRKAAYDRNLTTYNERIQQINDAGGATGDALEQLERERVALRTELTELRQLGDELSAVATQLNQLGSETNRLIQSYNNNVTRYNNRYSEGEEFTQGDYTGDDIHIYKFSNDNELVAVLAHEFGHALGIRHIDEPGALMYYLLEEGDDTDPALVPADLSAFAEVCQPDSIQHRLRAGIRSILP